MSGTDRSSLQPQQEWLLQILDTIDEGIHAVDVSGVTLFYNAAAGRLDGLEPDDVLGKHVLSVFPSLENETSTLLQVLKTGRAITNQPQTYTNFHGVKVHTVNTTLPILSGKNIIGALEVAKDLTQVRKLSEQVIALQAQMAGRKRSGRRELASGTSSAVYRFIHILTHDPAMLEVLRRAERAAQSASPILVYGETGTGKELLVQSIHNASPRSGNPFVAQNCAALPASLLEGILFGTVRGSFTGAEDRPGLFELADEGTLFLDEIQSMPLELQAKLLRVLQEGELMRLGDTRVRRVNVRVVAATNQSPETAMESGQLRKDLYYRINVVRLNVPPLREREGDLELLASHFIDKWNGRLEARVRGVTDEVRRVLRAYHWPGNVRELENAVEAALNEVSTGDIGLDALPAHMKDWVQKCDVEQGVQGVQGAQGAGSSARLVSSAGAAPVRAWADALVKEGMDDFWLGLASSPPRTVQWRSMQAAFERIVLARAVSLANGNVKQAAGALGLPRQTLQYRLQQLGL